MQIPTQTWNWPNDDLGNMKDLDGSVDDVNIVPFLELQIETDFRIEPVNGKGYFTRGEMIDNNNSEVKISNNLSPMDQDWVLIQYPNNMFKINLGGEEKYLFTDDDKVKYGIGGSEEDQLFRLMPVGDEKFEIISESNGKWLTLTDEIEGGTLVFYEAPEKDGSRWKIESIDGVVPSQAEVSEYGIICSLDKVQVPLVQEYDLGEVSSLKGKFFHPYLKSQHLKARARLYWMVNGKTDKEKVGFSTGKDLFLNIGEDGLARIDQEGEIEDRTFILTEIGGNIFALMTENGRYLTLEPDGSYSINSTSIDEEQVFTLEEEDGLFRIRGKEGEYISSDDTGACFSTDSKDLARKFYKVNMGVHEENILLASYYDSFKICGLILTEEHGTDVGVVYGEDIGEMYSSGIVIAHEFLRNQTTMLDLPSTLSDYGVEVSTDIRDCDNSNDAFVAMTREMVPGALDDLSQNLDLPIAQLSEVNQRTLSLDSIDLNI